MRLTKDVVICLELMELLKTKQYPARVTDLAAALSTTPAFLKQLVHKLVKAKVLTVKRGPGGGISRASSEPISVLLVFKALDRSLGMSDTTKEATILNKMEAALKEETC